MGEDRMEVMGRENMVCGGVMGGMGRVVRRSKGS